MQELKREITDLQLKIRNNKDAIAKKELETGNLLISSFATGLENTILGALSLEIRDLLTIEPRKKKEISRILEIEEQIKTLLLKIKEKKGLSGEKEKETRQHYRDIGAAAYSVYKSNPEKFAAHKEIFSELVGLEQKAEKANQQKTSSLTTAAQKANENFFNQFFTAAKAVFYEKKEDFYTSRQNASFKNVGKMVMDSDFAQVSDDAFLNEKVLPVSTIHGMIKQWSDEGQAMEKKITELNEDLAELGVKGNSLRRIKEIEKEIELNQNILDQKYHELGKLYLDSEKEVKLDLAELKKITTAIRGLEAENEDYRKQIIKLNARIEVFKLKQKITRNQGNIEGLKERIAKDKEEIRLLTKSNADIEKEIENLVIEHKLEKNQIPTSDVQR